MKTIGFVYLKIVIRENLFCVKLENWDRNTPSNSPRHLVHVYVAEEVGVVGLVTCVWSWVSHSARHPTSTSGLAGVFFEAYFPWTLWTQKAWIVSRLVRIGLEGKDGEECSTTTSRNEMEVNTK